MYLVSALLPLYVLGTRRVGRVPLNPAHTPIPDLDSSLSSVPDGVASTHVDLDTAVVMAISIRSDLTMTPTSTPLNATPSLYYVGDPTPTVAALPLPHVKNRLVLCSAVTYETDVIRPNLSSQECVQYGAVLDAISFGVESDIDLPPIRAHGAQVAFATSGVEELPKLLHDHELGVRIPVIICLHLLLHLAPYAAYAANRIPPPSLFQRWKIQPDRGVCHPLTPFHIPLYLAKLQQRYHLHVI